MGHIINFVVSAYIMAEALSCFIVGENNIINPPVSVRIWSCCLVVYFGKFVGLKIKQVFLAE